MRRFLVVADDTPPRRERRVVITAPPGPVAEGVQCADGTVIVRWLEDPPSTTQWTSIQDMTGVHDRAEAGTRIVWLDQEATDEH